MRSLLAITILLGAAAAAARGYQHAPPRGDVTRRVPSTSGQDWSKSLWVTFEAVGGPTYEGGVQAGKPGTLAWRPLSLEGYTGAERAVEAYGRLRSTDGKLGPCLTVAAYFASGGARWAEVSIGAESIHSPLPGMAGHLVVRGGDQVVFEQDVACPDETGIAFRLGTPFPIVQDEIVGALTARLPKISVPDSTILRTVSSPDPDPTWYTHTTGSPRNTYFAPELMLYLLTNDRRLLERLSDFAFSQYGFIGSDGKYRPGRPYHLVDENGEPWQAETDYHVDQGDLRPARMFEGRPRLMEQGIDTLGRRPFNPKGYPKPPRNGYDQEHMEAERLFAAAILMRSERARHDLMHLAEGQWSEKTGIYHSSRTLGWCLRLYTRAYQVFRRPKDRARLDEILTRAITMENYGGRAKITSFLTRDYWTDAGPGFVSEATWQAATIATAARETMYALGEKDDEELRKKAEEVFLHAAECCLVGWRPDTQMMVDSYEVFTETAPGSGIPAKTYGDSRMGVAMWPIAAFALAFEHTKDERFGTPGRVLTRLGKESSAEGVPLNSLRSHSLPLFIEANRIFKVDPAP